MHVGSSMGLCLPEYTLATGQTVKYNNPQCVLYDVWEEMCDYVNEGGRPDLLIGNGDIVDGKNSQDEGIGCWTTDLNEQANMGSILFKMTKSRNYAVLKGTKYHCGVNANGDQLVCDKVGGDWKGISHLFKIEGITMHMRHKISTANKRETEHGALARERTTVITEYPTYGNIDILARSHRHSYCYCGKYKELDLVTPCFKAPDSFISEFTMKTPDIGYIVFEFDKDEYYFDPKIYKLDMKHFLGESVYI